MKNSTEGFLNILFMVYDNMNVSMLCTMSSLFLLYTYNGAHANILYFKDILSEILNVYGYHLIKRGKSIKEFNYLIPKHFHFPTAIP